VYGLIFLFRYQSDETGEGVAACPDHIWFANQVVNSSCASVALMNIVSNIPGIQLGPELAKFKDETMSLCPARRGQRLASFKPIRSVHNSFARAIDMCNADLLELDEYNKRNKKPKKVTNKKSKKWQVDPLASFHFVAYLPIENEIWRLDGLDEQPQKMGK
jgi:ubiquitin carboxyl-terminal hydrolase L5